MKIKGIMLAALSIALAANVNAGGLLTNTNQSAAFIRQMSSNAVIDITSLYTNPAGTAFLSDGWHLSLNVQSAYQQRNIETTFPLFMLNQNNPTAKHEFKGKATAPVIPSFQLSYNKDKWSVNAAFAITGGGGKCEFGKGLGSFEALYAGQIYQNVATAVGKNIAEQYVAQALPLALASGMSLEQAQAVLGPQAKQYAEANLAATMGKVYQGYSLDAYMKGRQYYFGLTLGGTYKILENLSAFGGLRIVYGTCNYNGFVQDVKYTVSGQTTNANSDLTLNCEQEGWGFTPIIGVDWKINDKWNVAAKYELKTRMRLENKSEMNDMARLQASDPASPLSQFADGKKVEEDVPAVLAYGVQFSPIETVRLNAGMNVYFDKNATKYGDKHKMIDKNSTEVTFGAEWDVCKRITVSGSWQNTSYGLSDEYMNDLSFNLSSNSLGLGLRIKATERTSIDAGYMHTFYKKRTVDAQTAAGVKTDVYDRKNDVFAVGVNIAF